MGHENGGWLNSDQRAADPLLVAYDTRSYLKGKEIERAAVLELVRGADSHKSLPICTAGVEIGWNLACEYLAAQIEARGKE